MTGPERSVVHDQFVIERTYPAAPERVFAAWASQSAKSQWFGGEGDADVVEEQSLDFRVGGREQLRGTIKDGPSYVYDGTFCDIVDGQRIVWAYDMHLDGRRISVSVATVEIAGVAGGSTLVLTEQGAFLDGLDNNADRRAGTEQLLDQLGTYLTG